MVSVCTNSAEEQLNFASSSLNNFYGASNNLISSGELNSSDVAERMRTRLKWHYMNAYEKYKAGGRKPWKLFIQIIKIFLVTIQVCWFGSMRFSVVNYLDETHEVFRHMFFINPNLSSDHALYTKSDVYNQINFTASQYEHVNDFSLGAYGYSCGEDPLNCPITMCIHQYVGATIIPSELFYSMTTTNPEKLVKGIDDYVVDSYDNACRNITTVQNGNMSEFVKQNNIPDDFYSVVAIDLDLSLQTIKIEQLKFGNSPQCVKFNLRLKFRNDHHTGKLEANLHTIQNYMPCNVTNPMQDQIHYGKVAYDIIVILVCFWSLVLTTRSFYRNFKLAVFTFKFFKLHKNEKLSVVSDGAELVNIWFLIILLTDILTIVGSVIKIYIDTTNLKEIYFYDVCSLCLGIAVLFIWIGILRYLGFLQKYNILLITLQAALPSVIRFLSCAGILYFGFLFCGWIILGPYHPKFTTLSEVSECLFSLINGDDMFMTFREMYSDNYELWVFSKVYLYIFISLFIYVVISLFIGIISDTYERLKSGEHVLCSTVKKFIHGPECPCYSPAEMIHSGDSQHNRPRTNSTHSS